MYTMDQEKILYFSGLLFHLSAPTTHDKTPLEAG